MGLRDRIKGAIKSVLGQPVEKAAPVRAPVPAPVRASEPVKAPVQAPTPQVAAPAVPVQATGPDSYIELGPASKVAEGKPGSFGLPDSETVVAVFRHQGQLYAIDNACAHEDGPIGEGDVKGTKVKCPYHDWEYDFTTGQCTNAPDRIQKCWKIKEENGKIFLGPVLRAGTAARGGDHNDGMEVIVQ